MSETIDKLISEWCCCRLILPDVICKKNYIIIHPTITVAIHILSGYAALEKLSSLIHKSRRGCTWTDIHEEYCCKDGFWLASCRKYCIRRKQVYKCRKWKRETLFFYDPQDPMTFTNYTWNNNLTILEYIMYISNVTKCMWMSEMVYI